MAVLSRLMQGVGTDVQRYRELVRLLEEQFQAVLRHDADALTELARSVTELVATLDATRRERVAGVHELLGKKGTMTGVIALLDGTRREALAAGWQTLEALVRDSKRLNTRNCQVMMDQHSLMQRVMHGEVSTYAPA